METGVNYKHVYYRWYKGVHGIILRPTKMVLQLEQFINFLQIKPLVNLKTLFFAINVVDIGQASDTLHVDLFSSIS